MKPGIGTEQSFFIQSTWRNKLAIGGGISYDVFNGKNLFTGDRRKTDYLNLMFF